VTLPPLPAPLDEQPSPERERLPVVYRPPPPPPGVLRAGVRCGLFAAAATAGAIAGFALHEPGGMLAPYATTGRMLLGVAAGEGRAAQLAALAGGLALHVLVVVAWAVLFAALARALRGARLWLAAALYAASVYWVSEQLLPPLLRLGHGARAFPAQLALLYAVLAVALAIGMRLAFSDRAGDARNATPAG